MSIDKNEIRNVAINTLMIERNAIMALVDRVDDNFAIIINCILNCKGRIILTGMGKSGHIGCKIAATLASTGTPSFFMHPAEAFHGDLGMVTDKDIVIAISNSGESSEIVKILPIIKRIGASVIAMCGNRDSNLGKYSDYYIDISVEREACLYNLAPTASTTATLAMGDALALALMKIRNFTDQDFAVFHAGGALGRKLLLTVEHVMHKRNEIPMLHYNKSVKEALFMMTDKGMGAVAILNDDEKFIGLVTDGDIRRALAKSSRFLNESFGSIMTITPTVIKKDKMATEALSIMNKHKPSPLTVLPVVDQDNWFCGMLHVTDLLKQGVV